MVVSVHDRMNMSVAGVALAMRVPALLWTGGPVAGRACLATHRVSVLGIRFSTS